MLTKESLEEFLKFKNTQNEIYTKSKEIFEKIHNELVSIFGNARYLISINIEDFNRLEVKITFNNNELTTYFMPNEVLIDDTTLLIEIRNFKDHLYDVKKSLKAAEKPKTWIQKILEWI
jgi:hypothetical protein